MPSADRENVGAGTKAGWVRKPQQNSQFGPPSLGRGLAGRSRALGFEVRERQRTRVL